MPHPLLAETTIAEIPSDLLQPEGWMAEAGLRTGPDSMPAKKAARFPREARLLRHADFERVYKQGRRHFSVTMTVFYWARVEGAISGMQGSEKKRAGAPAPHGLLPHKAVPHGLRVGFTVGRALGGAVQRNRMKRRLREAVRMTRPVDGVAADVVINPKKTILSAEFTDVVEEVKRAFEVIEQKLSGISGERASRPLPHGSLPDGSLPRGSRA
ncbi:MAG: ribonuclease P protein component [Candidatus Sulfotelmatobacter sp.]